MSDQKLPPGTNFCQCSGCRLYFRTVKAFVKHRHGQMENRACMTAPELAGAGLVLDSAGYWRFPKRRALDADALARLRPADSGEADRVSLRAREGS